MTAEPAALLVPPRLLRRVLKRHAHAPGFGPRVPHQDAYAIAASELLALVGRDELGLPDGAEVPPQVILLPRPDPSLPPSAAARARWRGLFHAQIDLALSAKSAAGELNDDAIRRRIDRIGEAAFDEIRAVLRDARRLLPPAADRGVYCEFAALYLELRHFDPHLVPIYFPALGDPRAVDALLAEDVSGDELLARTRPAEAVEAAAQHHLHDGASPADPTPARPPLTGEAARAAKTNAEAESARGNLVRAALLYAQTDDGAPSARTPLDLLVSRLQKALLLSDPDADGLRAVLPLLLPRAAQGMWTVEARLLFDLQKVCVDNERGVFASNALGWLLSLGRKPLKRPEPCHRQVLLLQNLRRAIAKVLRARLDAAAGERLASLLESALEQYTARLRQQFRPLIAGAFEQAGLTAKNMPERVARDKVVEELLDRILSRGLLTLGDVRDALSRNQLKLPDLSGPVEWLRGDPLLRLNDRLAAVLDGVYRRGEVYLRGLQRLSSLAFATRPGRLLTRFVALPFGGAFVLLTALHEILHKLHLPAHVTTPVSVAGVGVFLLLLLHVPPFRREVVRGLRFSGRVLGAVFLDAPAWVLSRPAVRAVLDSAPVRVFSRYLFKPLLVAGVGGFITWLFGADGTRVTLVAVGLFAGSVAFFASRFGEDVQDAVGDRATAGWERVSGEFIPALFRAVLAFFKAVLDRVERLLYAVDERLRFRSGDSTLSLVFKSVAGAVWAVFAYVVRFCLVLLIEPQVNPIKHFPTVTVAHKLLLPLIPTLAALLNPTEPLLAYPEATLIISSIPGLFGFLVWELKENWKLYAANRPEELRPVIVGSHGETVVQLLRPGFHSGTLPKLYRRLRKAARKHDHAAEHRLHHGLHHVEESVRHLVGRELLHLLGLSRSWGLAPVALGRVALASNRIRIELVGGEVSAWLALDLWEGGLLASVERAGWLGELSGPRHAAFVLALAGLYKVAGVERTREQTPGSAQFGTIPLRWATWVEEWERDQAGAAPRADSLGGYALLPAQGRPAARETASHAGAAI